MNKKQLSLQNASLFAELERKAKEMEILSIRLEDSDKKIGELNTENEELKNFVEQIKSENDELKAKIEKLEKSLTESESKAAQTFAVLNTSDPESICKEDESNIELIADNSNDIAEDIFERFYKDTSDNITEPTESAEKSNYITQSETEDDEFPTEATPIITPTDSPLPQTVETETYTINKAVKPQTENSAPTTDLLRDYGAKIIGKVTRVTAEVLSKVSAINDDAVESLKTLALGKNESFKFQIMELAKRKGDHEKIMAEMDFLADEAIVYLRSI